MNLILLAYFHMWAQRTDCAIVTPMPRVVVVEEPWSYQIDAADACGRVLEIVSAVYLPHGGVLGRTYFDNGNREYALPSLDLFLAASEYP